MKLLTLRLGTGTLTRLPIRRRFYSSEKTIGLKTAGSILMSQNCILTCITRRSIPYGASVTVFQATYLPNQIEGKA